MILETLWAALEEMADVRVVGSAPGEKEALACYATPDLRSRCEALGAEKVFDKSTELEELVDWFHDHPKVSGS